MKGEHVIAKVWDENHERWKRIDKGEAGVKDAKVIQKAVDYVVGKGGGKVVVMEGTYRDVSLSITVDVPLLIDMTSAKLIGNGTDPVIYINTNPSSTYFPIIQGGHIDGNLGRSDGIKIVDSYHVMIRDVIFERCNVAINARIKEYWTESLMIENVRMLWNNTGILFETEDPTHKSFAQPRIFRLDINTGGGIGIDIKQNCNVTRGIIEAMIWVGNGIGIQCDGYTARTKWFVKMETGEGGIGIKFGSNMSGIFNFYGNITGSGTAIDNSAGKQFIWQRGDNEIIAPTGVFTNVLKVITEDGKNIFAIIKTSDDKPVLGTFNSTLGVWDYGAGEQGNIKVKFVQITEIYRDDYGGNFANFTPPSPVKGKFFFAEDTNSTNPAKRLYVCLDGSTWSYVDLT